MHLPRAHTTLVAAALVAFTACETQDPVAPSESQLIRAPATAEETSAEPLLNRAPVIATTTDLFDEFATGSGISGSATLTRSKDGLWLEIDAENLVAGHAHTVWWVIFENPTQCVDGCAGDDLGRRAVQATLVNADGFVADASGTSAGFETHLDRHDVGGRQVLVGDAKGVDNPYRAEVHIVVRSHGEAETDPADLAVQTSTVGGFCNLPDVGCLDVGVGVFLPEQAPGRS